MRTSKILTYGGFSRVYLDHSKSRSKKTRLYHLEGLNPETIQKAKAALLQALEKKKTYQGHLENFEENIKVRPYLLREGKSFRLIDEKESKVLKKSSSPQVQATNLAKTTFKKEVKVGRDVNIRGTTTIQNLTIHQPLPTFHGFPGGIVESETLLARQTALQETLKSYYQSFNEISLLFEEDEKLPLQNYARLSMIGESERKEKLQGIYKLELEKGKPAHDPFFEHKTPIELDTIFDQDCLINEREKRVLILGAAGIGKSTLCQYIAYQWGAGKLWSQFKAILWIKLRHLNEDFYPRTKSYSAFDLLSNGDLKLDDYQSVLSDEKFCEKALLILDGYDELPYEAGRGYLSPAFKELQKKFPHLLITSRPFNKRGWDEVRIKCTLEIIGFDAESIDKYIADFFRSSHESIPII